MLSLRRIRSRRRFLPMYGLVGRRLDRLRPLLDGDMMRYVLHPGFVYSKSDGDRHYINGPTLASLYGLDFKQCVMGNSPRYHPLPGDVHLHPRRDGQYR